MRHTTNSIEETQKVAEDFVNSLSAYSDRAMVVGLYGNLGAGKTTFTQALAKCVGVSDNVTSPTFVIEKIYELTNQKFTHLIHIDAYRLESSEELVRLGWKEIISDKNNLILIEWPEKVIDIMPEHIKVSLNGLENSNSREIEIEL
ncbi:MAG: tRNA (adenosine(37)-N6)-threonylcarbamoyltransferase complex ATPase subunit type 1 TsaE [Parcubacteria group bacterium]